LDDDRPQDRIFVGLKMSDVRLYFCDLLKAFHYCHNVVQLIHRDIKPENIVINHNNEAVLIDFGISYLQRDSSLDLFKQTMGTKLFYSPEMWGKQFDSKG